jgi:excisionase family DNA binding protein
MSTMIVKANIDDQEVGKLEVHDDGSLTIGVTEAAKLLGIPQSSMYPILRRKAIPSIRVGKRWLIPKGAIEEMINKSRGSNADEARGHVGA